jgi:hypothetical protein
LPWPRFSGQISVRGGKGREGEGKWGCGRVSRASWMAIGAAGQVVHLATCIVLKFQNFAFKVFDKMSARK